ncbi:lipoprotein [Spiroplasma endosymbiont of Panorpa germanica]|uniref:lipoprotein n=1 Tax=Spiroplasma endosymbiont of Panorpa germanica TaxID=3066314 RepID=UPI0030CB8EEC
MRKLLSILAALTLVGTSASSVVACDMFGGGGETTEPEPEEEVEEVEVDEPIGRELNIKSFERFLRETEIKYEGPYIFAKNQDEWLINNSTAKRIIDHKLEVYILELLNEQFDFDFDDRYEIAVNISGEDKNQITKQKPFEVNKEYRFKYYASIRSAQSTNWQDAVDISDLYFTFKQTNEPERNNITNEILNDSISTYKGMNINEENYFNWDNKTNDKYYRNIRELIKKDFSEQLRSELIFIVENEFDENTKASHFESLPYHELKSSNEVTEIEVVDKPMKHGEVIIKIYNTSTFFNLEDKPTISWSTYWII